MKRFVSLPCDDQSGRLSKAEMERGIRELRNLMDQGVIEIGPYDADVDGDDLLWMTDREDPPSSFEGVDVIRIKPRK